jgi:uncharacterized protein (DUF362 family)
MAKGVAIKFKSYNETIPKLLELIKFQNELGKHSRIVLKPHLETNETKSTSPAICEAVLRFCLAHKNPETDIFIAEGAEGEDTMNLYESQGYKRLAEQYSVGLIDLNNTEVEEIIDGEFLKFDNIKYPKILLDSFIVTIPKLVEDEELGVLGALSNMTGAFSNRFYAGFFSNKKNKIRKWPIRFSVHDILKCKMPEFAIIDGSEKGYILAGVPFEMDKQAVKLMPAKDWKSIPHLRLISESFVEKPGDKEGGKREVSSTQEDSENVSEEEKQ